MSDIGVMSWPDLGVYDPPPRIRANTYHYTAVCPKCHGHGRNVAFTSSRKAKWALGGPYPCHCTQCRVRWSQPRSYVAVYATTNGGWRGGATLLPDHPELAPQ